MPRARAQHETQFFPVIVSILQETGREDNAGRNFRGSPGAADSSPVLFRYALWAKLMFDSEFTFLNSLLCFSVQTALKGNRSFRFPL
jgi:hypothetical protein